MALEQVEKIGLAMESTVAQSCLVVSTRVDRQEMLARAASDAGWDSVTCADLANGWSAVHRGGFPLTLLDIQDCNLVEIDELRDLAQALAAQAGNLLVVCGNQGDPMEEVWVREAGAWLYLPGVEDPADLAMLCEEARTVAQRLAKRQAAAPQRKNEQRNVRRRPAATGMTDSE